MQFDDLILFLIMMRSSNKKVRRGDIWARKRLYWNRMNELRYLPFYEVCDEYIEKKARMMQNFHSDWLKTCQKHTKQLTRSLHSHRKLKILIIFFWNFAVYFTICHQTLHTHTHKPKPLAHDFITFKAQFDEQPDD